MDWLTAVWKNGSCIHQSLKVGVDLIYVADEFYVVADLMTLVTKEN